MGSGRSRGARELFPGAHQGLLAIARDKSLLQAPELGNIACDDSRDQLERGASIVDASSVVAFSEHGEPKGVIHEAIDEERRLGQTRLRDPARTGLPGKQALRLRFTARGMSSKEKSPAFAQLARAPIGQLLARSTTKRKRRSLRSNRPVRQRSSDLTSALPISCGMPVTSAVPIAHAGIGPPSRKALQLVKITKIGS